MWPAVMRQAAHGSRGIWVQQWNPSHSQLWSVFEEKGEGKKERKVIRLSLPCLDISNHLLKPLWRGLWQCAKAVSVQVYPARRQLKLGMHVLHGVLFVQRLCLLSCSRCMAIFLLWPHQA